MKTTLSALVGKSLNLYLTALAVGLIGASPSILKLPPEVLEVRRQGRMEYKLSAQMSAIMSQGE